MATSATSAIDPAVRVHSPSGSSSRPCPRVHTSVRLLRRIYRIPGLWQRFVSNLLQRIPRSYALLRFLATLPSPSRRIWVLLHHVGRVRVWYPHERGRLRADGFEEDDYFHRIGLETQDEDLCFYDEHLRFDYLLTQLYYDDSVYKPLCSPPPSTTSVLTYHARGIYVTQAWRIYENAGAHIQGVLLVVEEKDFL